MTIILKYLTLSQPFFINKNYIHLHKIIVERFDCLQPHEKMLKFSEFSFFQSISRIQELFPSGNV